MNFESFKPLKNVKETITKSLDKTKLLLLAGIFSAGIGNIEAQNSTTLENQEDIKNKIEFIDSYAQQNGKETLFEANSSSTNSGSYSINEKYKKILLNNGSSIVTLEDFLIVSEDNGSFNYIDHDKDGIIDRIVVLAPKENSKKSSNNLYAREKKLFADVDTKFHEDIIPESILNIDYLIRDCKHEFSRSDQVVINIKDKELSFLDYRDGSVASDTSEEAQEYIDKLQEKYIKTLNDTARTIENN
jgi:hypothetical protein